MRFHPPFKVGTIHVVNSTPNELPSRYISINDTTGHESCRVHVNYKVSAKDAVINAGILVDRLNGKVIPSTFRDKELNRCLCVKRDKQCCTTQ